MSKFEIFWNQFTLGGYKNFLEGLKNTALIALFGLLIGFLLGCVIATVKLIPKKNPMVDFFKTLCNIYIMAVSYTHLTLPTNSLV